MKTQQINVLTVQGGHVLGFRPFQDLDEALTYAKNKALSDEFHAYRVEWDENNRRNATTFRWSPDGVEEWSK